MINLIKLFKKLPQEENVDIRIMQVLFDTFVLYECGPIQNQTSALLIELYKRLNNLNKSLFVEGIINLYLADAEKIKNLKISEKYSVDKIMKFLKELEIPTGSLYEKLKKSNSPFLTSLLLKLCLNNIDKFGIDLL